MLKGYLFFLFLPFKLKHYFMKKLVALSMVSICLTFTTTVKAQEKSHLDKDITEKEVPAPVMKTFKEKHPNQKVEQWEMKAGNYEADFKVDGKLHELSMKADGTFIELEKSIEKSDVPKAVLDAFAKSEHKDWAIDHAEEVKTPEHEKLYEITVKKGKEMKGLYYTPDGSKIVRVEKD
jgi:hypothetical protein